MAKANPGKYITGPIGAGSSTTEREVLGVASQITQTYAATQQLQMKRDAIQQALIDKENLEYQNMYKKIDQIPETGVDNLDKNINSFFNENADKIFQIKKHMKDGNISLQEGNKAISQLTNYIDKYADLAPKMIAQAQYMKDSMKNGTLSRVNVDGLTAMMMGIADNSADIKLVEKDGLMYLTGSGSIKTADGDKPWNYNINLDEFNNMVSREGYTVARTIPTIKDIGLDAMYEAQKALVLNDRNVVSRERRYNPASKQYEYVDVYNKEEAVKRLVGQGVFKDLLQGNDMDTVWADVINKGKDAEWVKNNPWNPNDATQTAIAENWFANEAVERNIPGDKLVATKELEQPTSKKGGGGVGFGSGGDIYLSIMGLVDEETRAATSPGQFKKAVIDLDEATKYLTQASKGKEFFSLAESGGLFNEKNVQSIADQAGMSVEEVEEIIEKSQVVKKEGDPLIAYIENDEFKVIPTNKFDGTIKGMLSVIRDYAGLGQKVENEIFSVMNNIDQFGGDIQSFRDWYDATAADAKIIDDAEEQAILDKYRITLEPPN